MPRKSAKKAAKKKSAKKVAVPKRTRIKLKPNEVVRLVAPPGHRPVVVQEVPHAVEVAPISKKRKMGWLEYLFGI